MKDHVRTEETAPDTPMSADPPECLDDDITEAVERSYAMRLTEGTDLSEDERKRIQEKQRGVRADHEASTERNTGGISNASSENRD